MVALREADVRGHASALAGALDALRLALDDLDLDSLSAAEQSATLLDLHRMRGVVEESEARVLSRWDGAKAWLADDAKTGAAWLAWKEHIPLGLARQRVRHARALRALPEVAAAWAAGEVERSHITTMLAVRTPRTREAFERDYPQLLEWARQDSFVEFKRRCDRWELMVDPDGAEQGADAKREAREVHLSQTFDSMWFGKMTFDPVSGAIVDTTLKMIEKELFKADWTEASERLGRTPLVLELARTPAQRRADAVVEMAQRARTAPVGGRRPEPLFTVVVGLEQLTGPILELFNRTMLTPGDLVPFLTDAMVERVVFESPSRVLDVGERRRFFSDAQRRAIEVRDRVCSHETCDEVPLYPHVDHIHEHARGGATTLSNGRLMCSWHNLRRNKHGPAGDASPRPGDPTADDDPP